MKTVINIICEGYTERAYLQELNRFIRDNGDEFHFKIPKGSGDGGNYTNIVKKYKDVRRQHPNDMIKIWVDKDIYIRIPKQMEQYANKPKDIPDFLFNYYNGEDFLIMHMDVLIESWQATCSGKDHFNIPMTKEVYLPLIESLVSGYKKGDIPFEISKERLLSLCKNNKSNKNQFHSDFADFLEEILRDFLKLL